MDCFGGAKSAKREERNYALFYWLTFRRCRVLKRLARVVKVSSHALPSTERKTRSTRTQTHTHTHTHWPSRKRPRPLPSCQANSLPRCHLAFNSCHSWSNFLEMDGSLCNLLMHIEHIANKPWHTVQYGEFCDRNSSMTFFHIHQLKWTI